MRCFLLVSIVVLLAATSACSGPDTRTEKGLGKSVFEAIRSGDPDAFYACIFHEQDRDYLLTKIVVSNNKELMNARGTMDYKIANWQHYRKSLIEDIRREGVNHGIDWKTITFDSIVFKTQFRSGIPHSDITVYLHPTPNGAIGRLDLDDCLKTNRGWVIYDDVRLSF